MEKEFWNKAVRETLSAALLGTAFCLFGAAIFALFVRAAAPSAGAIKAVMWSVEGAGVFLFSLLLVRRERAFFKGIAAGLLTAVFSMLLFAAIAGGFYLDAFYPLELLLMAALGGAGAICGAKLRKE